MSPDRWIGVAVLIVALACSRQEATEGLADNDGHFNEALPLRSTDSETIAQIEADGRAFPRDDSVHVAREYVTTAGTSLRECVQMPPDTVVARRSGEFVVGGMMDLATGRRAKVWWKPLNSSVQMQLLVRGRRLGLPADTLRFESADVTGTRDSRTLEWIPEIMFFPSGFSLPSPGTWVVVATSGRNWGCFVFQRS